MRLEVNNISFQYSSERTIFRNLTFSYETPGILCILGSNGTGKSTLLKCLLHQNHIQKGTIRIDGKEVEKYRPRELARKVAYLPQSHVPSCLSCHRCRHDGTHLPYRIFCQSGQKRPCCRNG